jgi:hypothetical protein
MAFLWLSADGDTGVSVSETAKEARDKLEDDDTGCFVEFTLVPDEDDEHPWRKIFVCHSVVYAIEQGVGLPVETTEDEE